MIEIKHLNKNYGSFPVLNDINLTIVDGEIFGMIGHSGAGKSTLLRCINGLESYSSGSLTVDAKDVSNLSQQHLRELRKDIGMIFQHFSLLERKTVYQNIALPMECFGYSKKEIEERVASLLHLVGLEDKRNQKTKNLSGGQKQRVAIARALTMNPKVLLCDEATSALDPNTTDAILDLLMQINEQLGITIVMVTHQMEVIKKICTRMAIMDKGEIIEVGKTDEIFLRGSEGLKKIIAEKTIVLPNGTNLQLYFSDQRSNDAVITKMAKELDIDVSIVYGKLEQFRYEVLGTLVINIPDGYLVPVSKYLDQHGISWQEVQNGLI